MQNKKKNNYLTKAQMRKLPRNLKKAITTYKKAMKQAGGAMDIMMKGGYTMDYMGGGKFNTKYMMGGTVNSPGAVNYNGGYNYNGGVNYYAEGGPVAAPGIPIVNRMGGMTTYQQGGNFRDAQVDVEMGYPKITEMPTYSWTPSNVARQIETVNSDPFHFMNRYYDTDVTYRKAVEAQKAADDYQYALSPTHKNLSQILPAKAEKDRLQNISNDWATQYDAQRYFNRDIAKTKKSAKKRMSAKRRYESGGHVNPAAHFFGANPEKASYMNSSLHGWAPIDLSIGYPKRQMGGMTEDLLVNDPGNFMPTPGLSEVPYQYNYSSNVPAPQGDPRRIRSDYKLASQSYNNLQNDLNASLSKYDSIGDVSSERIMKDEGIGYLDAEDLRFKRTGDYYEDKVLPADKKLKDYKKSSYYKNASAKKDSLDNYEKGLKYRKLRFQMGGAMNPEEAMMQEQMMAEQQGAAPQQQMPESSEYAAQLAAQGQGMPPEAAAQPAPAQDPQAQPEGMQDPQMQEQLMQLAQLVAQGDQDAIQMLQSGELPPEIVEQVMAMVDQMSQGGGQEMVQAAPKKKKGGKTRKRKMKRKNPYFTL